MDQEKLKEEKERLTNKLKEMSQKSESEMKSEVVNLMNEYNSVKDAAQVFNKFCFVEFEIYLLSNVADVNWSTGKK